MAQKISKKQIRSITEGFNQVLNDHKIKGHSIGKFSLIANEDTLPEALFCQPGEKACFDPNGNLICVPIDTPC